MVGAPHAEAAVRRCDFVRGLPRRIVKEHLGAAHEQRTVVQLQPVAVVVVRLQW